MSLTVVSTPIGNYGDITLRAVETLRSAEALICEEIKPLKVLLKRLQIPDDKPVYQLNEHNQKGDLSEFVRECRVRRVALVSDCGTPGFCDPGAALVDACLKEGIPVDTNPGASSLMALLSVSGIQLKEFHFVGFLPAERGLREKSLQTLKRSRIPLVIMDTPYRLTQTLKDFSEILPQASAVLGIDLTSEEHRVLRGPIKNIARMELAKAPFVLILLP